MAGHEKELPRRLLAKAKILLVEDDEIMRISVFDRLTRDGFQVAEAEDGKTALTMIKAQEYHLVLSDIRMPGLDGTRLLEEIVRQPAGPDVILMTAYGSVEDAVQCLKKGAADYILKPFDLDDLTLRIKRLLEMRALKERCVSLAETCRQKHPPIIGISAAIQKVLNLIVQVAMTDSTVLITGESGTGKELVAAAIHYGSRRADSPYIRINCAAIPEGLIESELFGHEKGAFTGAVAKKVGRFEQSDGGTLLLDEIGELPLHLQAKLLRVLQEMEIERVGGTQSIKVDVRIICATAKNLSLEVKKGAFREDLFYRLQVVPIEVPPLRQRKEDIPTLCRFFLDEFSRERGIPFVMTDEAMARLATYDYPGNVRELRNIIERATVLTPSPLIQPWNLPADLASPTATEAETPQDLAAAVALAEQKCILQALKLKDGNRTDAAQILGISRKNLWEKMKQYQLEG